MSKAFSRDVMKLENIKKIKFVMDSKKSTYSSTHISDLIYSQSKILICEYLNNICSLAAMSGVCKSWHATYGIHSNRPLWEWLVRNGAVPTKARWPFWCSAVGVHHFTTEDEFSRLMSLATTSMSADIARDVKRAFGSEPNKRFAHRR